MSRCKSARKNWNCAEWIQIWIGKGRPLILSEKKYIILVKNSHVYKNNPQKIVEDDHYNMFKMGTAPRTAFFFLFEMNMMKATP